MQLGQPVIKLDMRNKKNIKKYDDAMSASSNVVAIFSIYGQFVTIWKPDSGCLVCKTCIFISSNLLSNKKQKLQARLKNLKNRSQTIALIKGTTFAKKCWFFPKKNPVCISKTMGALVINGTFSEITHVFILT